MGQWLEPAELRVGLGCMRLSTDEDRDESRASETIAAAAEAGITVFDTARAYGRGENELGHNERMLARELRRCGAAQRARIVTKGGMSRPGGAWVPDGRARSLRADCEASLAALDGLAIDLYVLHAPDPRRPWHTSICDQRAISPLLPSSFLVASFAATLPAKALQTTPRFPRTAIRSTSVSRRSITSSPRLATNALSRPMLTTSIPTPPATA